MENLPESTAVAHERVPTGNVRPGWLVKAEADGHAFFDALEEKIAAREAEVRAELAAALAVFDRVFVGRAVAQIRLESEGATR
jgi:hypothetical protein